MEATYYIGLVVIIVGGIGFLIAAFRESILWGVGCLFLWPVSLVFLVMHWSKSKNPFFLQLVGMGLIFISGVSVL